MLRNAHDVLIADLFLVWKRSTSGVYQEDKPTIFTVNALSPYIWTTLIDKPKRFICIGSNMQEQLLEHAMK